MAGYSGKPLFEKLGITAASRILTLATPRGFALNLPPGAKRATRGEGPFDVALVFVLERGEVAKRLREVAPKLTQAGGLWFAWPKKASGVATTVTEDVLRAVILPTGFVDNKVCAVDETYSGLRFVRRKSMRT